MTTEIFQLLAQEDGGCTEKVINVIKFAQHCHYSRTGMDLVVKHNIISEAVFYEICFCKLGNIIRSPFLLIVP